MPRKIDLITELYRRTVNGITEDSVAWRAFLRSAAYQYKYPFSEQVMIYAQRPFATACAEFEVWSNHFGRRINRGATGIALITGQAGQNRLKYVFDVSDTYHEENKFFSLWEVPKEYESEVADALALRFGAGKANGIYETVISACENIVRDNISDYLSELAYSKDESLLEEFDDDNLRVRLSSTVSESAAYAVLTRLGYNADNFIGNEAFEYVHEFDTPESINVLGNAFSELTEICMREIEKNAKAIQKKNRILAASEKAGYNEGENKKRENGGIIDEIDLQNRKRDTVPKFGASGADESRNREIWQDEIEFYESSQEGDVHDDIDTREAEQLPARDRRGGGSTALEDNIRNGTALGRDGEDEGGKSVGVGENDEQHQTLGRGNGAEGADLRLSEKPLPAPLKDTLMLALRHGDYLHKSKKDIVSFLLSDASDEKKTEYIKGAYNMGLYGEFYRPGTTEHIGYHAEKDGLLVYQGNYPSRTHEIKFTWDTAAKLIEALINDGIYLEEEEKNFQKIKSEEKPIVKNESFSQLRIPQEVVDELLRLGGCTRNSSARIYGFYRRANNIEENIRFLKKEYSHDSVGIVVGDKNYAAKWDDSGIYISAGDRVSNIAPVFISWEMADRRIRELLEIGQYIPKVEAEKADEIWETYVADKIAFLYRDDFGNIPEEYKTTSSFLWPKINDFYRSVLNDRENLGAFIEEIKANEERLKDYPPRLRRFCDTDEVLFLTSMFLREPVDFPEADPYILPPKQFVTQDKIDEYFARTGSPYSDGKLTIYSFFFKNKDLNERAKFLSKQYGTGGTGGMRTDSDYNGKGIALYGGLQHRENGVFLKWPQVAKRIDTLIREGKYITEKDAAEFDRYEREQVARMIRSFYFDKPAAFPRPYVKDEEYDYWKDVKSIASQIENKARLLEITEMMQTVFETLTPESKDYSLDKERLSAVKAYGNGKYNLFPNSPYRKKHPFAPQKEEKIIVPELEGEHERKIPESEYNLVLGTTVYIGKDECDIMSLSEDGVELFNGTLIPLEMDYETFMKRIRENPMNDRLKKPQKEVNEEITVEEKKETAPSKKFLSIWERYDLTKKEHPGHIAMIRVGDFYEFFYDDAKTVANVLDLTLTSRQKDENERVPMCGVPYHALERYLQKILDAGYAVAAYEDGKIYPIISSTAQEKKKDENIPVAPKEEIKTVDEIERAKQYIFSFFEAEYGDSEIEISNLSKVPIAHTTVGDEDYPINVYADLTGFRILKYLGEDLIEVSGYGSLKELNDNELCVLEVYELTAVSEERIEAYRRDHGILASNIQETKPQITTPTYGLRPDIPESEKHNYRITDDMLGTGGTKEKFRRNIEAIKLLHLLEAEDRLAIPEEQEVLAGYTGWGGLADAFDSDKDNWHSEYEELKNLLSEEEYEAAKESTLTAFYTPPTVMRAMYKALENMGFKRGNILEPSCGIGNFMGMLPESMEESKVYGVELDSISGRIARQLYQKNGITVSGYEKTQFPDSFFDVAIGNVPFGQFKVIDKKYDKQNFLIHDYFFAKTLDKVRPGGVIAFITSSGTLDKENPAVRKYIAQRADLIGAIRLPDTAFKDNAGTRVISDILFLQKRDRIVEAEPDWIHLDKDENGIVMNKYFVDNPDMVMGEMAMRSGPYGPEATCKAYEDKDFGESLMEAVSKIHAEIKETEREDLEEGVEDKSIPADPNVKNYSYTFVDGKVYYRQNSIMKPAYVSVTAENRIKGLIAIREIVRELISAQLNDEPDSRIRELQKKLGEKYDKFTAEYGLINSRGNSIAFSEDDSYFLLCSLEILDDNKALKAKADMFTKRTIKPQKAIERVDTASEALAISIGEHAFVDMEYMSALTGKSEEELFADLKGVIFLNPYHGNRIGEKKYLMADEYLSGNVREKLAVARKSAELNPEDYTANVEALEKVQPVDLNASEIGVRLGSTWIPQEDVEEFMHELLDTNYFYRRMIEVKYIPHTSQWVVTNKTRDGGNVKAGNTYGTKRINAYSIIEDTLNLKDVRIFDYQGDDSGNRIAILNKKETAIAQGKQEQIKRAFEEWIWKDPERRERLCRLYNEKFNSLRPREFDGSHIEFYGMNPEISLRKHQKDAVARIIYGGNSLLAHVVGAGKTFTMVAAAQESKRLGLCSKSMFVVPNHLIEQWASEYLQLYPSANILVASKKDFEKGNRKKFCARIATGDYDAVIIGQSQFEKIPMSVERQAETINAEIEEVMASMEEAQASHGDRVTVKQLARAKKQLETKLAKLNDQSRKDDVVTFEQLGVDRMFVDEAHYYKNLAAFSKMRNVAGISQTEAQKSSDLYMKCRYLDEITGGKGCIFATGTPISNTMVELYTMQKYLQYDELKMCGLLNFDAWASTFGETVTAIELAPDGTGYRAKTRFAKFFNIPELMSMFKQTADIQTADMLKLPVPEAHYHIVKTPASDMQKELVASFAERAEKIHNRMVDSSVDNMLLVTNDGRKAALDQRLVNPALFDYEGSKVNVCVDNIYKIWAENADKKSAQLLFCDLSTPTGDGSFNVYDDIRAKLIEKGVPPEEIEFIHNANTDAKKKELFGKVREGQVRILMGSTFKMGAGTNVQKKLIALHDLDVPWRPSDLEQRAGRIVRQGNSNLEVDLYRYVTEGTFDAYSYQLLESKQKFISQIMTSKSPVRSAEDVDETALSYAEIKALASGNPKIMEKMELDADVAKLKLQKADHLSQRYALEDSLVKKFPREIAEQEERIKGLEADMENAKTGTVLNENGFSPMDILGAIYEKRADAGKAILDICERISTPEPRALGAYRGFKTEIGFDTMDREFYIVLCGALRHKVPLGKDAGGIITRLDNAIEVFEKRKDGCKIQLEELYKQVENAKKEIATPFAREAELEEKCRRLAELNAELDMDKHENEIVDGPQEQGEDDEKKKVKEEREER